MEWIKNERLWNEGRWKVVWDLCMGEQAAFREILNSLLRLSPTFLLSAQQGLPELLLPPDPHAPRSPLPMTLWPTVAQEVSADTTEQNRWNMLQWLPCLGSFSVSRAAIHHGGLCPVLIIMVCTWRRLKPAAWSRVSSLKWTAHHALPETSHQQSAQGFEMSKLGTGTLLRDTPHHSITIRTLVLKDWTTAR